MTSLTGKLKLHETAKPLKPQKSNHIKLKAELTA